jgi:hypothetical protein
VAEENEKDEEQKVNDTGVYRFDFTGPVTPRLKEIIKDRTDEMIDTGLKGMTPKSVKVFFRK